MKKVFISILVLILLAAVFIPLDLFLIGEPVDGKQLHYEIHPEGDILIIHITTPESAVALRRLRVRQEGSHHYISMRKVLVSPLFPTGSAAVKIDILKTDAVYLGGKLIWSSK